jgi:O-acetyl-ADP-ribose deacetylase (regulator of RNase III)
MINLIQGDLTRQDVEAIVNAANSRLAGGGGVDGAIHKAGGPIIADQCQQIVRLQGGCTTGQAVITDGGNLKAKYVIHTVGPIWRGGMTNEENLLAQAYENSLHLAQQYQIKSMAFPSISTGAYGFPVALAAQIALETVTNFNNKNKNLIAISFVLFDKTTYDHYQTCLETICSQIKNT